MDGTIENTNNNSNQPVEANAGAVANLDGLMTVRPAVESLPDIENPVSEAEPISESSSPEAELKVESPEVKEAEKKEELSEIEKENLQIMEALPEKYPHTFAKDIDDEKRPYLIFKGYDDNKDYHQGDRGHIIICQKGIIRMSKEEYRLELETTGGKLTSRFTFKDLYPEFVFIGLKPQEYNFNCQVYELRNTDREELKKCFSKYEEDHKNDVDVEPRELTTQEIIDSL